MNKRLNQKFAVFIFSTAIVLFVFYPGRKIVAQNHLNRYKSIDVLDYRYEIELNDNNNEIKVRAIIKVLFKTVIDEFNFDLQNKNEQGKGMLIDDLMVDNKKADFNHQNDLISITCTGIKKGDEKTYVVNYHGIPDDGLIISTSKFGDRVFFADCWPNRARHWLACVDHPSDKATVEFVVKAPAHYQVVANGSLIEETNLGEDIITGWKTDVPLPTKVMVIGVARFAKQNFTSSKKIPVSSWVYPQNRAQGFKDYRDAALPLDYFIEQIGPYPYSKLANVQSKTVFGGMENAGCIFYFENSVTGQQIYEDLFAHEIAHQWFGNSVSEFDFHHIWLSEGFATYLENLYMENLYGRDELIARMKEARNKVTSYARGNKSTVVDTTLSVSMDLLSPNSYEKGAWFLHMLRHQVGDELFWKCIRTFYEKFKYGNALTDDFRKVVEEITGKAQTDFFKQWLYQPVHPKLASKWNYKNHIIALNIKQLQKHSKFSFPLEIKIIYENNSSSTSVLSITKQDETFTVPADNKPKEIVLDPEVWLLFENAD